MGYIPLGDIYGNQRLGSFEGSFDGSFAGLGAFGSLDSARRDLAAAQRERDAAGQAVQNLASAVIRCTAIPGSPTMPRIACPTTAASQQAKLGPAQSRYTSAENALARAKDAVSSEESAANIRGAASIINPLASAGAQIAAAFIQADALKNAPRTVVVPGGTADKDKDKKAEKTSALPLIIGGVVALGVVVGVVVMMGNRPAAKRKRKRSRK